MTWSCPGHRGGATSDAPIQFVDRPVDDPKVRRPDTRLAWTSLGWRPEVSWQEGLAATIAWFSGQLTSRGDLHAEDLTAEVRASDPAAVSVVGESAVVGVCRCRHRGGARLLLASPRGPEIGLSCAALLAGMAAPRIRAASTPVPLALACTAVCLPRWPGLPAYCRSYQACCGLVGGGIGIRARRAYR